MSWAFSADGVRRVLAAALSPTSGIVECNGRPKPVGNIADHHHHKSILQPMDYELGFLKN